MTKNKRERKCFVNNFQATIKCFRSLHESFEESDTSKVKMNPLIFFSFFALFLGTQNQLICSFIKDNVGKYIVIDFPMLLFPMMLFSSQV